ncbi:tetratricopeptide repeat protein [Planctomycetes bacterium K23_9]|uniref:tetratricopeptide repeat protein n=1 Tax=Stieleria marina TaxID=1930275 RepID=UPI0011A65964
MPIQLQCTSVVIRNEALDRCLDGGAANFGSIAPNAMSYGDDRLSQASFMSSEDAEQFAKDLELRGIHRKPENPEFVIVAEQDRSITPECDWLVLFDFEDRFIATIAGSESLTVIAPADDQLKDKDSIRHHTAEEIERDFEFVSREDGIDCYREKSTGQLVYHARKTETDDELFRAAFDVVWKHHRDPGQRPVDEDLQTEVREAIETLQGVLSRNPEAYNVALGLGMAWFSIGATDRARTSLARAGELAPENTMVLKEWAGVCLADKDHTAAVEIGRRAVAAEPDSAELLGNLAVAQLLAVSIDDAKGTIQHALTLDPNDQVNQRIEQIVQDVDSGKRPQPATLAEMMAPPK